MKNRHLVLSAAIAMALVATGCGGGGGGGGVKDPPPPPPPTEPPPPTPPPTEPPPPPPPVESRYRDSRDNLLVPTNGDLAHEAGYTGQGAKVGLLDDGRLATPHPTLDGRVAFYNDYTSTPGVPDSDTNAKRGHGTVIADSIVGRVQGPDFNGGIAPDAQLYWGRICLDNSCWSDAAGRAVDEMVDQGVSIFNLSLGSYYGDDVDGAQFSSAAWASGMKKAVDANGLVVVSTGNDSKETSGFPAAAPLYEQQLRNNWLAVTAVDVNADGSVSNKASYANACGDAAQWCMAAPGLIRTPGVEGTQYTNGAVGTSMSAGVVSGTAALVLGAYPWMTGANLQTTLLTTATDLGAPGVDAVFGWGLVNADKAVRGPGQFIEDFNANVSSGSYVFDNDISGEGGLVKDGAGTLELAGANTFTGSTQVNAGVLAFSGDTASSVFVNDGGTYSSRGGKLGGNYTARDGATTEVAVGSPLQVDGTANLDGTLRLINPATDYTVGGRENVLEAGSVAGTFDATTYGSGFFWSASLDYSPTSVVANLTRTSGAASAASAGASQSVIDGAGQLDSLIGVLDGAVTGGNTQGLEAVLDDAAAVMNATDGAASASLSSLTGQIHGTTRTLGVTGALNSARLHADRLPHLAATEQRTAWISGTHIDGDLDRSGYESASYRHNELTVGIDVPVAGAVVGASISQAEVKANIAGTRDAMESNSTGLTVYGVKPLGDAYVSGTLGYTTANVDSRREILVGTDLVGVSSDRDDSTWHARVEAGRNFDNGLTPFVAAGTIRHKQDAFSERGDTTLGLAAGSDTLNLNYLDVGLRHRFISNQWTVDSLVAYRNAFDGTDTSFDAWFNGLPEGAFTINGQPIGKEAVRAMVGVGYAHNDRVTFFGNVGAEKVSGQQDNVSAQLGVRVAF